MVTRSSGGASVGEGAAAGVPSPNAVPHSMQNLAPAGFSAPQLGHSGMSSAPQDMQKRADSGFSAEQLGQVLPSIELRIGPRTRLAAKDIALACGAA